MSLTIDGLKLLLIKNKKAQVRIVSDSMHPLIRSGEILSISPLYKELSRFDLIIFDYYGNPFCHFFWSKIFNGTENDERIFTRSLKNPSQTDIPILPKDILGLVTNKKINWYLKIKVYLILFLRSNGK